MPGIVTQIVKNHGIESCKPFDTNMRFLAYSDILQWGRLARSRSGAAGCSPEPLAFQGGSRRATVVGVIVHRLVFTTAS